MAAQPRLSTADIDALFEPIQIAVAQLNDTVVEGKSALKRTTDLMDELQTFLRDFARDQRCHNDKNTSPHQNELAEFEAILRLTDQGLTMQDRGSHPPLQHQRDNVVPPEPGRDTHPYHCPRSYGAATEQPIFRGHGHRLSSDSTSYIAANELMVSGQRKHCPNRSALPYSTPEDKCIADNKRCGHTHSHRTGDNRHPLISVFKPGSFLETYHNPRDPHSRRGLHRGLDTGHHDVESIELQPTHGREAGLDNIYHHDLAMPSRPHHHNSERANVRAPWHHSTDYPLPDGFKDHRVGKDLYEPRSTSHLAPLTFFGPMDAPTAAEMGHWPLPIRTHNECDADKRRLEQTRAQFRQQQEQFGCCEYIQRGAGNIARPPRPAPSFSNDDLEQLPHRRYDVPSRPNKKGTMRDSTARKDGSEYPRLLAKRVQQLDGLTRPPVGVAISTAVPKAAIEDISHRQQYAQGPVVEAKRSNTAHNDSGVGTITDLSNNDESPIIPSNPSSDSSESSESGYDTPDFDESSSASDEDKDDSDWFGWAGM